MHLIVKHKSNGTKDNSKALANRWVVHFKPVSYRSSSQENSKVKPSLERHSTSSKASSHTLRGQATDVGTDKENIMRKKTP